MANLPISQLPATTAINDPDLFAIEQNGVTKRIAYATIKPAATGSLPAVTNVGTGDLLQITQGGVAKKVTVQQLLASVSGGGINFGSLPQATSIGDTDEFLINQGGTQKKVSGLDLKRLITGNAVYPVGSIYLSTSPTNPSTYFGGTWVAYAKGRTIVGIDPSDSDFATAGQTGGEKSVTLTEDQMPKHSHTIDGVWSASSGGGGRNTVSGYPVGGRAGQYSLSPDNTGGDAPHNNMPPYIATYIWQRTS